MSNTKGVKDNKCLEEIDFSSLNDQVGNAQSTASNAVAKADNAEKAAKQAWDLANEAKALAQSVQGKIPTTGDFQVHRCQVMNVEQKICFQNQSKHDVTGWVYYPFESDKNNFFPIALLNIDWDVLDLKNRVQNFAGVSDLYTSYTLGGFKDYQGPGQAKMYFYFNVPGGGLSINSQDLAPAYINVLWMRIK